PISLKMARLHLDFFASVRSSQVPPFVVTLFIDRFTSFFGNTDFFTVANFIADSCWFTGFWINDHDIRNVNWCLLIQYSSLRIVLWRLCMFINSINAFNGHTALFREL